ncbi:cell division protein FtsQ/DivIB [Lederbergia lenta]|uniref:Cell division protein DivIB n=1 Tax=Lederbergia lenta TaxID=1467 RepID=A0A2X4WL37_LEDLE|nr:FtsQ-type POTRA domain-containing protein [Lederbergia lenta]MCM3110235.1 FtsQ-type POTRA domain-containing protein [Lederbergia lenta]MEC2324197.1 FtsQ-type POTRA domain-containing protein [Lederbergia lenta]SQI60498.1 cell division protein FtsQ [Lederbergia lenta]
MQKGKVLSLEERIPKIKEHRRRKANRRLILLLSLFFLLIVSVVYFQSPLSHIKRIEIKGNDKISSEEILSVTKMAEGLNIWKVDKRFGKEQLLSLPEIKTAEIKVTFPNVLKINVVEYATIAYMEKDQQYYPLLETGKVLNQKKEYNTIEDALILINFKTGDVLNDLTAELKQLPTEITNVISEIRYDPKKTDKYHIYLYTNDGNEVRASIPTFSEKMIHYPSYISQLDSEIKGVLDLEVGSFFKAFEIEGEGLDAEGKEE